MARAQFQKGQKVWVECVGAWTHIEKVQPVWAKGFDEPVRVTYDVGLGRDFAANELQLAMDDPAANEVQPAVDDPAANDLTAWRLMRARNKWQAEEDCLHHPYPGSYPVVVTDAADWGGWRVPGAEYDRDPERIEFQARLIAATPQLARLAEALVELAAESPDDAPQPVLALAREARDILSAVSRVPGETPAAAA